MSCLPFFQTDTLLIKIEAAKQVIREAYEREDGRLFLSFSGGKDSTVLQHIALSMYPDLKVVFSNTTNELAEVLRYVKQFPHVITVVPDITFIDFIGKYGFPLVSKEVSQKVSELKYTQSKKLRYGRLNGDAKGNGKLPEKWRFIAEQDFDISSKCCKVLKKDPLEKWAKEYGLKPMIALMADESMLRNQLALYGNDDGKKVYPFLRTGWTEDDIWAYADMHHIRFAECYYNRILEDGTMLEARVRTGCEYCGNGIHLEEKDRFKRSRLAAPKRYEKVMSVQNNGVTFAEAIEIVKKPHTPTLDLYGLKYKAINHHHDKEWRIYSTDSTVITKKCPYCESKKTSLLPMKYRGVFFDTPHPQTKEKRTIVADWYYYDCGACGKPFSSELHMLDTDFMVTNRLIEYIAESLDKKSSTDIMNDTGISEDALFNILRHSSVVRNRMNNIRKVA